MPTLTGIYPTENSTILPTSVVAFVFDQPIKIVWGTQYTLSESNGLSFGLYLNDSRVSVVGDALAINIGLSAGLTYHFTIPAAGITDFSGNPLSSSITLDFTVASGSDTTSPLLLSTSPVNGALNASGGDVSLQFNELVKAGNGNLYIHAVDGTIVATIAASSLSSANFSDGRVNFSPPTLLPYNTQFYVTMDAGTITDLAGNPAAGISSPTSLEFTTGPDTTPPNLTTFSPYPNSGVALDANIILSYSEAVVAGSGNIVIAGSNGFSESIAITDASQVSISGNVVTVNPNIDLPGYDRSFTLPIPAGIVKDTAGNASLYAQTTNFATIHDPADVTPPTLLSTTPTDNATGVPYQSYIYLQFDEPVQLGSGHIKIYNSNGTLAEDATQSNDVGYSGDTQTLSVEAILQKGGSYYLIVDPGAVTDVNGNAFGGITSPTALAFTTEIDRPQLLPGEPANGSAAVPLSPNLQIAFTEAIHPGSGNVNIYTSSGSLYESISVTDASQVSFDQSGIEFFLTPAKQLQPLTSYYILLDAGLVVNDKGNGLAAVTSTSAIAFTTAPAPSPPITVSAGQTVSDALTDNNLFSAFTLTTADLTDPQTGKSFLNNGSISVSSTFANPNVTGILAQSGGMYRDATIVNNGLLQINAPNATYAFGVNEVSFAPRFTNSSTGTISVVGDTAAGLRSFDPRNPVTNAGTIEVTGKTSAAGLDLNNTGWHVTNSGTISVHGGDGFGPLDFFFGTIAVNLDGGQLINSGEVKASADADSDYAIGVLFIPLNASSPQIFNSGDISAPVAIVEAQINGPENQASVIVNSGTIEGLVSLGIGDDLLTNSGTITGDVEMGTGDDVVNNSGTITGGVTLGLGNDVYNGASGTLNGTLDAGSGDDTIYLGKGSVVLDGGPGNDTVVFSGASSSYSITTSGPETVIAGPSGTATVAHVENLVFADKTLHPANNPGLIINVSYDASVANAPAGFTQEVDSAVQYLESLYSDPVSLNIEVGYGEIGGKALEQNALGEAQIPLFPYSYPEILAALNGDATSAADLEALSSLSQTSQVPFLGGPNIIYLTQAEAKSLGLDGSGFIYNQASMDGEIGFDATSSYDLNATDGVSAGSYDLFALAVHEITHVMGRTLSEGQQQGEIKQYQLLDLFRYSAAGTPDLAASPAGYFSINGGTTDFADFNGAPGADASDWATSVSNDAFDAVATPGAVLQVTPVDIAEMDILGWDLDPAWQSAGAMPAVTPVLGGAGDDQLQAGPGDEFFDGGGGVNTVGYASAGGGVTVNLQTSGVQSVGGGEGAEAFANIQNLSGSSYNDVLTGDSGNNSLSGGAGNDVLRGAGGRNVLDGGAGVDTAAYALAAGDYYVTTNAGGGYTVQGPDPNAPATPITDTLTNIENASFDATGQTLTLAQFVAQSFNPLVYIASFPDLIRGAGDNQAIGLQHFLQHGYFEGRGPGTFNVLQYIASYSDLIRGAGDNQTIGLEHYILHGYYEGRTPTFNVLQYIASYPDLIKGAGDNQTIGLEHYILHGYYEGRTPTFNVLQYIASYPDLIRGAGDNQTIGLEHYILHGYYEGRTPTFNVLQYIASYPDLIRGAGDNQTIGLEHYILHGYYEGRTPTFNVLQYIASYPDLIKGAGDNQTIGLEHYILHGYYEGRTPTFNVLQYIASYPDLIKGAGDNQTIGLEHYILHGYYEGRTATFDALEYLASNADLAITYGSDTQAALEQYILHGYYDGRPTTSFDAVAYLLSNPDLQNGQFDAQAAELQYVNQGAAQGRSPSGAFGTEQTQHALTLGTSLSDTIGTSGDEDWFSINLTAGQTYNLTLSGADSASGTLADPLLQLYNTNGVLVASDNDSGPGRDSLIHLAAPATGLYYLVAQSAAAGGTGTYKILATSA